MSSFSLALLFVFMFSSGIANAGTSHSDVSRFRSCEGYSCHGQAVVDENEYYCLSLFYSVDDDGVFSKNVLASADLYAYAKLSGHQCEKERYFRIGHSNFRGDRDVVDAIVFLVKSLNERAEIDISELGKKSVDCLFSKKEKHVQSIFYDQEDQTGVVTFFLVGCNGRIALDVPVKRPGSGGLIKAAYAPYVIDN